jgi:hypothetical protein
MLANSRVFKDHDQGGGGGRYQVVTMREIRRQKGRQRRVADPSMLAPTLGGPSLRSLQGWAIPTAEAVP